MFIKLQGLDIVLNHQVRFIFSFFPYVLFEHLLSDTVLSTSKTKKSKIRYFSLPLGTSGPL